MASVVANLGLFNCSVTLSGKTGEVTNAENIKADTPKILKPTHFSGPKDNKADSFSALINIKADMKKVNNKAKNWQKPDKY
jgi:hypothetical protein